MVTVGWMRKRLDGSKQLQAGCGWFQQPSGPSAEMLQRSCFISAVFAWVVLVVLSWARQPLAVDASVAGSLPLTPPWLQMQQREFLSRGLDAPEETSFRRWPCLPLAQPPSAASPPLRPSTFALQPRSPLWWGWSSSWVVPWAWSGPRDPLWAPGMTHRQYQQTAAVINGSVAGCCSH